MAGGYAMDDDDDIMAVSKTMDLIAPYAYLVGRFVLALAVVWFASGASQ